MSKPLNGRCCPTGNTVPNLCQVVGLRIGTGVEVMVEPAVQKKHFRIVESETDKVAFPNQQLEIKWGTAELKPITSRST
jgi:hypothetical protein